MEEYTRLRIEFVEGYGNKEEVTKVEFCIDDSIDIYELFNKMKRAAIAFGFSTKSVEKVFGEDIYV